MPEQEQEIGSVTLAVDNLLATLNVPQEDTFREQLIAFSRALKKNVERERTYGGLWREYGLTDCANNAKSKSVRLAHHGTKLTHVDGPFEPLMALHDDAMDDAIDLMNYGAFCARLIDQSARETGLTPS